MSVWLDIPIDSLDRNWRMNQTRDGKATQRCDEGNPKDGTSVEENHSGVFIFEGEQIFSKTW